MFDIFQYDFMRNALLTAFLISIACGIMGSIVVVNRLSSLSGGIAHAAYGGLGISVFFKMPLLSGAMLFSLLITIILGFISFGKKERTDTLIGIIWAFGMAVGIVLIDLTKGYYVDVMSFLFGSIVAVPLSNIFFISIIDIIVLLLIFSLYKEIVAFSYDEEYALISGVPIKILYYLILILITFCVIGLMRIVGLILVLALFTIPPSIAEIFTKRLSTMISVSIILSMIFSVSGIILSYYLDISSGASIILIASLTYFFLQLIRKILK